MEETSSQFENQLLIQEKEELLCLECIFLLRLHGYKVDKMEIEAWRLAHSGQEINETLNEEPIKETWLKVDVIPEQ